MENQSLRLAQDLKKHGWSVTLVDVEHKRLDNFKQSDIQAIAIEEITVSALEAAGIAKAGTVVAMLDNELSYEICRIAAEHFRIPNIVVRLHGGGSEIDRYSRLGVSIIDSASALVNVMSQQIRSPSAVDLLLGQAEDTQVIEIILENKDLHGAALRDLHLPTDILILAIKRRGQLLLTHGYNRLRLGDEVTIVGSIDSLVEVERRFRG